MRPRLLGEEPRLGPVCEHRPHQVPRLGQPAQRVEPHRVAPQDVGAALRGAVAEGVLTVGERPVDEHPAREHVRRLLGRRRQLQLRLLLVPAAAAAAAAHGLRRVEAVRSVGGARRLARVRPGRGGTAEPAHAEAGELDHPMGVDEHARGAQLAVLDVEAVQVREAVEQL